MLPSLWCAPILRIPWQLVSQLSNASEVQKIYTNTTTACPRSLSISLEENKTYQITIFAIRGEGGILNSFGEYSAEITTSCRNLSMGPEPNARKVNQYELVRELLSNFFFQCCFRYCLLVHLVQRQHLCL